MAIKFLQDIDVSGEVQGTSLDINGAANISGTLVVGASGTGRDVTFHGDLAGEYFMWDENVSSAIIYHRDEYPGLEVYVNAGAQTTQPQLKVGRSSAQYWGAYVDDRNAHLIHRQDETSGIMTTRFDQWDSNTSDTTGEWLWRFGGGDGSNMASAMRLTQGGELYQLTSVTASGEIQGGSLDINGNADISGSLTGLNGSLTTTANYFQLNTPSGYIQIGAMNTSHAHIYTDRPNFYTNKDILVNGATVLTTSTGVQKAGTETITGQKTFSGNTYFTGEVHQTGVNYGLYHGTYEDGYYFDDYNGSRNLSMFLKNQRSDIIRYQAVDNFEYWNGSAWVADASQESNVKKLLDGRQDTYWNVPSTYYKFRFTTNASTPWPIRANIGIQTSWSGSTWPGATMTVEEYDGSSWATKVTANFGGQAGGSATPLNSNDNSIDNWGLMFKSDSALHTGDGNTSDTTRITIDFYGWTPSNGSYTVIPLQNIFITSNYAGLENTDYTNLLDHGKNVTLAGNLTLPASSTLNFSTDIDLIHSTNTLKFVQGGSDRFSVSGDVHVLGATDFAIPAGRRLYLDGQSNTYITESSADTLQITTGGTLALTLDSSQNATFAGIVQASSYKISSTTVLQGSADVTLGSAGGTGTISLTTHTSTPFKIENDDTISIGSNTNFAGNVSLVDNKELIFGTGDDVKTTFDGSNLVTTVPTGSSFLIGTNGGTPHNNNGTADFAVDVNAQPRISLYNNQVQFGGSDMNWSAYFGYDGNTKLGAWDNDIHIFTQGGGSATAKNIYIRPQNAGGTITTVATFNGDNGTTLTGAWSLGDINGGSFKSYTYGTELDISSLNSGGWARAHRIITSDSSGQVFFGVLGNNTTTTRAYWTLGDPDNMGGVTGYNSDNGIVLLKNGNVGIGTTNPSYARLQVNGTTLFQGASQIQGDLSLRGNVKDLNKAGSAFINTRTRNTSGSELALEYDYVKSFNATNGGDIGIGTTSPDSIVHIKGTTDGTRSGADAILHVEQDGNWSGNEPWGLYVEGYSYLNGFRINAADGIRALHKVDSGGQLGFSVTDTAPITFTQSNSTERMRVHTNGFIGIGTSSPGDKLHVQDGYIRTSYTGGADFKLIPHSSNDGYGFYDVTNSNYDMWFDGGLVGIGTQSPNTKLHLYANGANVALKIEEDAGTHQARLHLRRGGSDWELINDNHLTIEGEGTERFRITTGGNVGIGVTNPSKNLVVAGTAQVTGEAFFGNFDNISGNSRMRNDLKLWYNTDRTFGIYGNASKIAIYGNSQDMLTFNTSSNATFAGTIDSSHITSIGTVKGQRLQAESSTFPQQFIIDSTSGGGNSRTMQIGMSGSSLYLKKSDDTGSIIFRNSNNTNLMTIGLADTGQVTVLNELEAGSLDINGNADVSGVLTANGLKSPYVETNSNASLFLRPNGSGNLYLGDSGNGAKFYHYSHANDGVYSTYQYNGNYYMISTEATSGIYINDPLRVDGAVDINGNADISGTLDLSNDLKLDLDRNIRFGGQLAIIKENNGELKFYGGTNSTDGGFEWFTWNGSAYESALTLKNNQTAAFAGNVSIAGNLTTEGDLIINNTSNVSIKDTIITLNSGITVSDTRDIGLMFERVGNNKFFGWDESESYFTLAENTQDVSVATTTQLTMGTLQTLRAKISAETLKVGSGNIITVDAVKDEDNMASNSATALATQQSIKAYADTKAADNAVVKLTGAQTIAGNKTFSGVTELDGCIVYSMSAGSLDTTGFACAGLSSAGNGSSALFTFECGGSSNNSYQRIVYNCHNADGTWNTTKCVDEGGNKFDVTASANGSTITFTFKGRSGTQNYTPRVMVKAMGHSIVKTYT